MDPTFLLPHDLLRALSAFDSFVASEFSMRTRPKATSTLQIFRVVGDKRYGAEMLRIGHSGGLGDDAFVWLFAIDAGNPRVRRLSIPKGSPSLAAFIASNGRFLYRWSLQVSHCLAIYGLATAILKDFEDFNGHTAAYAGRLAALYVFPGIAAKAMAWLGTGVMPVLGTSAYGLTGALVSGVLVHVTFSPGVRHPEELRFIGISAYIGLWIFTKIGSSIAEYFFPRYGRVCVSTYGLLAVSGSVVYETLRLRNFYSF